MEVLKSIIRSFFHVLLVAAFFLFVLQMFFQDGIKGERDVFTAAAEVYDPMIRSKTVQCNGLTYLENNGACNISEVIYSSGAKQAGTNLIFKSLLSVKKSDGTIVDGTVEDDFAIYLINIKTQKGESVLETLSTSEIENLGEIPVPFIYDKATDRLYLYSGGVYLVQVKIYGRGGGQAIYEFQLPVEST